MRTFTKDFMIGEGLEEFFDETCIEDCNARTALQELYERLIVERVDVGDLSTHQVADAILLTEACNWAAKVLDYEFYSLKPRCIEECVHLGADGGWKNGIFYLYHPDVGVASFHDPMGEIQIEDMNWPFEWSGIPRQERAFDLLTDRKTRLQYRYATAPGELGEWIRSWLWMAKPVGILP